MNIPTYSHILHHPWYIWRLGRSQRGIHVVLFALMLAATFGTVSAAALPIPQGPNGNWLINRSSGKCLAASSNSAVDGVLVWQLTCQQEQRQVWHLTKPYLDYY